MVTAELPTLANQAAPTRSANLLTMLVGIYVTALVLAMPLASKFVAVGPMVLCGATLIFPITYIFNDIFTEVYGYNRSRQVIWTGMVCQIFAGAAFFAVGVLPPAPFWHHQDAYMTILGSAPRVMAASLTAYFWGEFANSIVLSKMKYGQHGERGWRQGIRFVCSTIVGEAVDTAVFFPLAFVGAIALKDLLPTMATVYAVKVLYEVVALPLSIRIANWIKEVGTIDQIDDPRQTRYNPLIIQ